MATHLVTFHRHTHFYFSFSEMINIASYAQFVHLLFSFMLHNTQSSIKKETCLEINIFGKSELRHKNSQKENRLISVKAAPERGHTFLVAKPSNAQC